jgi:hemerythrin-like domain-containing protein
MDEHRLIERGIGCLETMSTRARDDGRLDQEHAAAIVAFLRDFADGGHHGKEEVHLFPAMEGRGIPAHAGPTAVMRAEHDEGRAHVRAMSRAAAGAEPDAVLFARHGFAFASLLRQHIAKEDQILFPMADGMLPPEEHEALLATFLEVDAAYFGEAGWTPWVELIQELEAAYPAQTGSGEAPDRPHGCGGCV